MATMHLRPRGFSELIDATFEIVRARFRDIATVAGFMIIPGAAMSLVMVATMPDLTDPAKAPAPGQLPALGASFWTAWALMVPISIVVYTLGSTALVSIASAAYLGRRVDVGEGFAMAKARFWPVVGTALLKMIALMAPFFVIALLIGVAAGVGAAGGTAGAAGGAILGFVFLLAAMVGMPILMLRWAVTMPVAALEGVGPSSALQRSGNLTKGSKGRLFGLYFVFFVMFIAMYVVGAMLGGITGALMGFTRFAQVLGNVLGFVLYPLLAVLQTVIYYDLRIRNEGFDLEVMADGLSDGAPAGAFPPATATPRQPA